jgi:cyanate permease
MAAGLLIRKIIRTAILRDRYRFFGLSIRLANKILPAEVKAFFV